MPEEVEADSGSDEIEEVLDGTPEEVDDTMAKGTDGDNESVSPPPNLVNNKLKRLQEVDLPDTSIPVRAMIKKDSTRDLLIIFTDQVKVKFNRPDGTSEIVEGRWCKQCR